MLFTLALFPLSPDKDFKHFCPHGVEQEFRHCFADLPGTNGSGGTRCSKGWPNGAAGSLASSSCPSTTMANKITGGNTDARQLLEPMDAALGSGPIN